MRFIGDLANPLPSRILPAMKCLAFLFLLLSFCPAAETKFGPFADPEVPFLETSVDFRDWEKEGFPKENLVARGIILKLGGNRYACFDTDLLRVAGVWEGAPDGQFLTNKSIAAISYEKYNIKSEGGQKDLPKPIGKPIAATGRYLGWAQDEHTNDPRTKGRDVKELSLGPIPESLGAWLGLGFMNHTPVLKYRIGKQLVEEIITATDDGTIIRWVKGWPGLMVTEEAGKVSFRAVPKGGGEFKPLVIAGKSSLEGQAAPPPLRNKIADWSQPVVVRAKLDGGNDAYALDDIPLPLPNPWKRNVRLSGMDFFKDGRAAICTIEGDVWIVSGLESKLTEIKWKRFAAGMAEPQSIAVVNDEIYVFSKNGVERLHAGKSGACEFYENFCNQFVQSAESREFPMDMVKKPGGGFYIAKGGQQLTTKGEGAGRIYELSADGKTVTEFASGFRQPYLGINPVTGQLSASDQQGNYIPTSPIHLVNKGGYYGYPDATQVPTPSTITEATCWIPHEVNQSAAGQVWCVNADLGPLNNHLLHLAYFKTAAFKTFLPPDGKQAAVVQMPWKLDIPLLKGAIHPVDSSLYLCGLQVWGADAQKISGLKRVRYTGKPDPTPIDVRACKEGVVLSFAEPLDEFTVAAPGAFLVQRWNYLRSPNYGSAHYKLDGKPGHEFLPVVGAVLSKDGKSVFLRIDHMVPIMQLQVEWNLKFTNGMDVKNFADFTLQELDKLDFAKAGIDPAILQAPTITAEQAAGAQEKPTAELGKKLALQMGCFSCHSNDGKMDGMKGPSWFHLFNSDVVLVNGKTVHADEAYIKESVMNPTAKVRKGFNNPDVGMPPYEGILSENQLEAIILYFKQLAVP